MNFSGLSLDVVVKVIGSLAALAAEYPFNQAGVLKQIPVAKLIEFTAGGGYVGTSDGSVFQSPGRTKLSQLDCEMVIFSTLQMLIKHINGLKSLTCHPKHACR